MPEFLFIRVSMKLLFSYSIRFVFNYFSLKCCLIFQKVAGKLNSQRNHIDKNVKIPVENINKPPTLIIFQYSSLGKKIHVLRG